MGEQVTTQAHLTIVDSTDIESMTVEYARNQSTSTPPTTGWSTDRPAWAQGYYIWQRVRIHKTDTAASADTFSTAVCLTGSTGQTGATGETYIPLEYIESTSSKNSRINTNYYPHSHKITIIGDIMYLNSPTSESDFVGNFNTGANTTCFVVGCNASFRPYQWGGNGFNGSTSLIQGTRYKITATYSGDTGRELIVNDGYNINTYTSTATNSFTVNNSSYNIGLFQGAGTKDYIGFYGRMYSLKIYDNNVLVRDFKPMQRLSDKVNGMYDSVEGIFYPNVSTTPFIAGPAGAPEGLQGATGPEAVVTIVPSNINWDANNGNGSATLTATLRVNGTVTTPTSYKWTKGTDTTSLGTSSILNVSDLNATYNCTVTW